MATLVVGDTAARTAPPALRVEVAADRCKGCELCVGVCPKHVLQLDLSRVNALGHHPIQVTDDSACTSCALCVRVCPDTVFTIYAVRSRV